MSAGLGNRLVLAPDDEGNENVDFAGSAGVDVRAGVCIAGVGTAGVLNNEEPATGAGAGVEDDATAFEGAGVGPGGGAIALFLASSSSTFFLSASSSFLLISP